MDKEILALGDVENEKKKNYWSKIPVPLTDVDIENILVSNEVSFGKKNYKYFISYLLNNDKVRTLHIMLPKKKVNVKSYNGQTKLMYFLIEDDDY